MSFKKHYPDFAAVEHLVRQARAERAVYIATGLSNLIVAAMGGFKRLVEKAPTARPAPRLQRAAPRY